MQDLVLAEGGTDGAGGAKGEENSCKGKRNSGKSGIFIFERCEERDINLKKKFSKKRRQVSVLAGSTGIPFMIDAFMTNGGAIAE